MASLWQFTLDPIELVVRGTAVYWFLFALFRFVLRRDAGSLATADILLVVLIADAAQNAMAGGYESLADGLALVATLAAWNYLVDWLSFRYPAARRVFEAPPLLLIKNGELMRKNMRRELITISDVREAMHEHGLENFSQVKAARMESDGRISIVGASQAPAANANEPGNDDLNKDRPNKGLPNKNQPGKNPSPREDESADPVGDGMSDADYAEKTPGPVTPPTVSPAATPPADRPGRTAYAALRIRAALPPQR